MVGHDDFRWFKETFHQEIAAAVAGTPFTLDMLAAIAAQETGGIWGPLRQKLSLDEVLALCVGDTLDADRGRSAFPKTQAELIAAPRGEEMFQVARAALVAMSQHVKGFEATVKRPKKFCHGFGMFQYDLQFFPKDLEYFLQQRWQRFDATLGKCVEELRAAMRRMKIQDQQQLTDIERVHVCIAYNAGTFKPAKGLRQGHFDGEFFYGERIFDLMRIAQTAASPSVPAVIEPPVSGSAAVSPPTQVITEGAMIEVDVESAPLRLRSEPRVDRARPTANVIARLPDGQRARLVSGGRNDRFWQIETSLNGALLRGFAAAEFLRRVPDAGEIAVVQPQAAPVGGIVEAHLVRKSNQVTRRVDAANALSLNEPDRPGRRGTTPAELRGELDAIIDYLAVDKASHRRYQPQPSATFCNIYAHDYCHLAGVYLPRVWWLPGAIEQLAQGKAVQPLVKATVAEVRANGLFHWLQAFGPRFGWRQTGTLTKLQTEVNAGAIGLISATTEIERPGHITVVIPESDAGQARRDAAGEVTAPLQSQAGRSNFRRGVGPLNWWQGKQFADSAFWIHS